LKKPPTAPGTPPDGGGIHLGKAGGIRRCSWPGRQAEQRAARHLAGEEQDGGRGVLGEGAGDSLQKGHLFALQLMASKGLGKGGEGRSKGLGRLLREALRGALGETKGFELGPNYGGHLVVRGAEEGAQLCRQLKVLVQQAPDTAAGGKIQPGAPSHGLGAQQHDGLQFGSARHVGAATGVDVNPCDFHQANIAPVAGGQTPTANRKAGKLGR